MVIHGAKIHDYALIGMGAVVMDDAVVGEGALVAAGSVVLSRTQIGPHEMWAGSPAKFIKMVEPEKAKEMNVKKAKHDLMYGRWLEQDAEETRPAAYILYIFSEFLSNNFVIFGRLYNFASLYVAGACMLPSGDEPNN